MTARKRLDEMKQFIQIAEGAWDLPRTKEDFNALAAILNSKEPNVKIYDMLYNVLGDDNLFDRLDKLDLQGFDAPATIIQWMKDQRKDPDSNFRNIWKTYQLFQHPDSPMNEEDFGPAAQGKSDIIKKWGAEQSKEVTDLSLSGDDEELDEDPEEFKNTLVNPQWKKRRAAEIQKRKDWLRRTYQSGETVPDDLHMARVKTPKGTGTVYSIHNLEPTDPEAFPHPTVSVRLDNDPGGYGGGKLQYRYKLSDVEILPDELDEVGDVKFDDYGAVHEGFRVRPHDPWVPDTPVPDEFKRNGRVMTRRKGYQAWLQAERDKVRDTNVDEDGRPGFQYKHDPEGMGSYDIIFDDDTWAEALPYDKAEDKVEDLLQIIYDGALQAHMDNEHLEIKKVPKGDTMTWTVYDPIDDILNTISITPSDMPAGYTGESIELESVVEAVLEEYPGQPKDDYDNEEFEREQAKRSKHIQDQAKEFEQDKIDPTIEDDELGYRFD